MLYDFFYFVSFYYVSVRNNLNPTKKRRNMSIQNKIKSFHRPIAKLLLITTVTLYGKFDDPLKIFQSRS